MIDKQQEEVEAGKKLGDLWSCNPSLLTHHTLDNSPPPHATALPPQVMLPRINSPKPPRLNQLDSFVVKSGALSRQRFPGQLQEEEAQGLGSSALATPDEESTTSSSLVEEAQEAPLQSSQVSEYSTQAPLWSRQPFKLLYFAYFGLFLGLILLPWFALSSIFPRWRTRPSWTFKRSFFVQLYRFGTRLTYRTYTSLSRDLSREVPHAETVRAKFVWVQPLPAQDIRGEVRRAMALQHIRAVRTCGFWYGKRDGGGGVGQRAYDDEKVIYHLHGVSTKCCSHSQSVH